MYEQMIVEQVSRVELGEELNVGYYEVGNVAQTSDRRGSLCGLLSHIKLAAAVAFWRA